MQKFSSSISWLRKSDTLEKNQNTHTPKKTQTKSRERDTKDHSNYYCFCYSLELAQAEDVKGEPAVLKKRVA